MTFSCSTIRPQAGVPLFPGQSPGRVVQTSRRDCPALSGKVGNAMRDQLALRDTLGKAKDRGHEIAFVCPGQRLPAVLWPQRCWSARSRERPDLASARSATFRAQVQLRRRTRSRPQDSWDVDLKMHRSAALLAGRGGRASLDRHFRRDQSQVDRESLSQDLRGTRGDARQLFLSVDTGRAGSSPTLMDARLHGSNASTARSPMPSAAWLSRSARPRMPSHGWSRSLLEPARNACRWPPKLVVVIDRKRNSTGTRRSILSPASRRTFSINRWRRRSWIATAWCRPMLWTIPLPTRLRPWPFFAPLPMKAAADRRLSAPVGDTTAGGRGQCVPFLSRQSPSGLTREACTADGADRGEFGRRPTVYKAGR